MGIGLYFFHQNLTDMRDTAGAIPHQSGNSFCLLEERMLILLSSLIAKMELSFHLRFGRLQLDVSWNCK